jgi:Sec-independent protein translocase protein TatA
MPISPVDNKIPYAAQINAASDKYGVPATLIAAVIKQESGYNPSARSGAGAAGLMQLMPSTAAGLGVSNVYDPAQSIDGGTKYLAQQISKFNGNISLGLAAYNAGAGAVQKYGGIPPYKETQGYVKNIMAMYGGDNIDPGSLNVSGGNSSGSGFSLDIGATIVNGFQKIFQTLATDTTKFLIMFVLLIVFIFFGYKALQGSPEINGTIQGGKRAARSAKTTYNKMKNNNVQKERNDRSERIAKRKQELKKAIELIPK